MSASLPIRDSAFDIGRSPSVRHKPYLRLLGWTVSLIVLVNAGIIVWLWLQGGGISAVHGWGDLFTSIGRITGLLSAYFILIQVLLLARLPFLEPLFGFDRLTVWHRLNGKVSLGLVLAHVLFITIGYASMDKIPVQKEATQLVTQYPGMVAGVIGTVLMVVVVVTSLVIVRRRLRYEAWYLVHLTVYAAIILAWFHQIPTGNEFAVNATAAAYWTALYLVTLGLLVMFRFGHPILQALEHRLRVSEVTVEAPGVVSLRLTGRNLARFKARPGQFFLWRFLSANRWWESHPFSLSEAPDGRSFRITVKGLGDFSQNVGSIKPGTRVITEGPFGVFTDQVRTRERAVLIAGGIGITPIRSLLETMDGELILLYRVLRDEDLVFRQELEALAARHGITLYFVVGDHRDPGGERLMSPEHLHELVPQINDYDIYVCGPPGMAIFLENNVRKAGVPPRQIHTERFAL